MNFLLKKPWFLLVSWAFLIIPLPVTIGLAIALQEQSVVTSVNPDEIVFYRGLGLVEDSSLLGVQYTRLRVRTAFNRVIEVRWPREGLNQAFVLEGEKPVGVGTIPVEFLGFEDHPISWEHEYVPESDTSWTDQ